VRQLTWIDRSGKAEPIQAPPRFYTNGAVSPDGQRLAVEIIGSSSGIWIYDLAGDKLTPLSAMWSTQFPLWSPDGKRVVYQGTRSGFRNLFWRPADGGGEEERLTQSENLQTPGSWSPDGRFLLFSETAPDTGDDIWVLDVTGDRQPSIFLRTEFNEQSPVLSPDARWVAYTSDETGRTEIHVQPFHVPGTKWLISDEGGNQPTWSRDGRELFYTNGNRMMVVDISAESTFAAGSPRLLFEGHQEPGTTGISFFDVSLRAQRFLTVQPAHAEEPPTQITLVINWLDELKQRFSGDRR
jgi:Tol biopolymer transport system component